MENSTFGKFKYIAGDSIRSKAKQIFEYSRLLKKVFTSSGLVTKKQKKSRLASKRARSARKK